MGLLEELQKQMAGQGMFGGQQQQPQLSMGDLMSAPPPPGIDPALLQQQMQQPMQQPMQTAPEPAPPVQAAPPGLADMSQYQQPQQPAMPTMPGLRAQGATVKTELGGAPASVQAATMAAQGQNTLDDQGIQRDAILRQADAMEQHAAKLRAQVQVEQEQRQQQEKELAAKQSRLRDQQMELASQIDEPIDPKRYFKSMNTFEKMGAVIQAGVYGYLNPKGGANPIIQDLYQMAQNDVKTQLDERHSNQVRRVGIIDQYERQYQDTGLVAKRLEADRLVTMGKVAFAEAQEAESTEAKGRAMDLTRGLAGKAKVLHQEIQQAMYGKPVEVTSTFARPPTVNPGARVEQALKQAKMMEEAGYSPERIRTLLQAQGMEAPTGKSEFQTKTEGEQRKLDIEAAKLKEIPAAEKQKLIEKLDGLAMAKQGFDEMDATAGIKRDPNGNVTQAGEVVKGEPGVRQGIDALAGSIPFGIGKGLKEFGEQNDPENLKSIRRSVTKITAGLAHAESGAGVNEDEMKRYESRMPLSSATSFKTGSAELFREQKQKYKNLVGQYGKATVDAMLQQRGVDPAAYGE